MRDDHRRLHVMRLIHGGLHHTSSNPIRSKALSSSPPLCITPMGDVCCPPLYFVLQFIVSRRASEVTNHKSTVSAHSRVQQQPSHTRADAVLRARTHTHQAFPTLHPARRLSVLTQVPTKQTLDARINLSSLSVVLEGQTLRI